MPHLIIEYANDLAGADELLLMLDAVHGAALSTGLFEESHIKTRVIPVDFYRVGDGHNPFIHAQLRIHGGRTAAQKKALSEAVLAAIREQEWPTSVTTVEVVDMDGSSYAKYPE